MLVKKAIDHTTKFRRVRRLIRDRDNVRSQIEIDVIHSDWSEEATVAYLMFETGIRPGSRKGQATWNRETEQWMDTYGACSLQARHVRTIGGQVFLMFLGKKGVERKVQVTNPWLAEELMRRKRSLRRCDRIFTTEYWHVAEYIGLLGWLPKDFRTMVATCKAKELVAETPGRSKSDLRTIVREVANLLGNTPAVCRSSYIEPSVIRGFAL